MINTYRSTLGEEEIQACMDALRSGWLISGKQVAAFEEEFAAYVGAKYAVATSACTTALQSVFLTLKENSTIITSPITFTATVNAIINSGHKVLFADVDEWGNMKQRSYSKVASKSEKNEDVFWNPYYVCPIHFAGRKCKMDVNGLVIHDSAHAVFKGLIGHASCYSFHATKCMTTCQGGMIATNDTDLARRARYLRIHGMASDAFAREKSGPMYDVPEVGIKGNLIDPLAAIGRVQLRRYDEMWKKRMELASTYETELNIEGIEKPPFTPIPQEHSWHLYLVKLRPDLADYRSAIIKRCQKKGVQLAIHGRPVYQFSAFKKLLGNLDGSCPNAEDFGRRVMTLPLYPSMTEAEQSTVIEVLGEVMGEFA